MSADLHLHTTESDGRWTPQELVLEAARRNLTVIAITDHDTTAGIAQAQSRAPQDLEVIAGIELSTSSLEGDEVHILGYWIDPEASPLQKQLQILREARIERARNILDKLRKLGIHLAYEEVLRFARREVVSRSHIAAALQARGLVRTKEEAFSQYIGLGGPAYVERSKFTPEKAIETILKTGGVPVLAHPGLMRELNIIPTLLEAGLVGLEVVHSSHNPAQTAFFRRLAQKWNLLPAGGSDCHGPGGKDQLFIGDYTIPLRWVAALAAKKA